MRARTAALAFAAALVVALAVPLIASAGTPLTAHLTGKQIVNPNGGAPNGSASVVLKVNRVERRICFTINYKGLTKVTGAHLHKGNAGQIARPIVTLFSGSKASPAKGCVKGLKQRIVKRLKRKPSQHYVDIDTKKYPNGAVRGQLSR